MMKKCDFCSESSANPNEPCPVQSTMTRSTACKEAAERFYNYMMQVAAAQGHTYNKNININDKKNGR